MKNLAGLMKQASQMQAQMQAMQAKLEAMEIQGESGAGMVTLVLTGKGELRRLRIDPKLADPAETEMLEDLVVAAHADAQRKLEAARQKEMEQVAGGLPPGLLPPGMKLPF